MPSLASLGSTIQKSLPSWDTTKTTSKAGFDKAWSALDLLGGPVNKLSHQLGSEAFWPTTLDKESDKAARILRSFCKDGFYGEEERGAGIPKGKQRVVKKIPTEVVRRAKGLAIFTTCRTGLWVSGAGGSGVLVGRMADGSWSPPSGILLHIAGLGFLVGVDIYDCVIVINTEEALHAFTKLRCTLGGEVSAVAGPVGIGGILETEIHKRQAPVWTYLKSRGFYAGVQVDGTIVIERKDENEKFYGERLPVGDILAGKIRHPPREIQGLMNTIKAAQGDTDVDEKLLPDAGPTPGDLEIEEVVDEDPFGIHALEKEGLEIHEAGTQRTPSFEEFTPRSPSFKNLGSSSRPSSLVSGSGSGSGSGLGPTSPPVSKPPGLKNPGPKLPPRNPLPRNPEAEAESKSEDPEPVTLSFETPEDQFQSLGKAQAESDPARGLGEVEERVRAMQVDPMGQVGKDGEVVGAEADAGVETETETEGEEWKEAEEVHGGEPASALAGGNGEKKHEVDITTTAAAMTGKP